MDKNRHQQRLPKLPHEHDESAEESHVKHGVIQQARRDVMEGKMDTDNYTRATAIANAPVRRRRLKP